MYTSMPYGEERCASNRHRWKEDMARFQMPDSSTYLGDDTIMCLITVLNTHITIPKIDVTSTNASPNLGLSSKRWIGFERVLSDTQYSKAKIIDTRSVEADRLLCLRALWKT